MGAPDGYCVRLWDGTPTERKGRGGEREGERCSDGGRGCQRTHVSRIIKDGLLLPVSSEDRIMTPLLLGNS